MVDSNELVRLVNKTQTDISTLMDFEQYQGERFSNWTTTEFNVLKSALSILSSNHADMRNDINYIPHAINQTGNLIAKLDNSVTTKLEKMSDAINAEKVITTNLI